MNLKLTLSCVFLSTAFLDLVLGHVRKFNQMDFDKWLDKDNFLVVLFCQSAGDQSCIKEREKINILSEQMLQHKDLVFGYISKDTDSILISRYDVQKFPIVKFFPYNNPSQSYLLGIRIPDLKVKIGEVKDEHFKNVKKAETTTKALSRSKRKTILEIDWLDVASTVKDPEKHAFLILYDEGCYEVCQVMERVASIFQDEDEIVFYKLSLDKTGPLRKTISFAKNPTVFWYPKTQKDGYVYGGKVTFEILVEYINDHAGLSRNYNGDLKPNAGRIEEVDQIIQEHIISILLKTNIDYVIYLIQSKTKESPHNKKYIDYYLAILKEIKKGVEPDKVLIREQDFLNKRLSQNRPNNKEAEEWRKFYNIISAFIDFAANRLQEDRAKSDPKKESKDLKRDEPGHKNRAHLKQDPKWKGAWKRQSRHEEL